MPGYRSALQCAHLVGRLRPVKAFALAAFFALAACSQAPQCDMEAAHDVAFTSEQARERVVVRTLGARCDQAVGVLVLEAEDGAALWSWSAPLAQAFGEVFAANDGDAVEDFLTRWAAPELSRTEAAPEWSLLAPGQTTLDRLTYEDLRARDTPMLCHFSGSGRQTCVFWEPAAGFAGHFYDRDAPDAP